MAGTVRFVKAQARGNDFLVIEESSSLGRHAQMAQKLCARHTGVGADGIEFLDRRARWQPIFCDCSTRMAVRPN